MNTLLLEEREDGISILSLYRPKQLNALNVEMLDELEEVLGHLSQGQTRGLIVTGAGDRAFAAGADIAQMHELTPEQARDFSLKGNRVFGRIEQLPFPVIAAVNGYALGGGCELAMSCDIVLCSTRAVFGQPETGLGICPGFGGTIRLMRRIGVQAAKELIYSGRYVKAQEAVDLGLALKACEPEQLMDEALRMLGTFIANSASAVYAAKRSMFLGADTKVEQAAYLEAECFSQCFAHPDQRTRMEAFLSAGKKKEAKAGS